VTGGLRVLSFGLILGALFAGAVAAGSAVGPIERGASLVGDHAQESSAAHSPAGLSVSENGLSLVPVWRILAPERPRIFSFRVFDSNGRVLRAYDELHERRMHFLLVRRDLTGFQHLHPVLRPDGMWTTTLKLDKPGAYRAFADFASRGRRTVLAVDLAAPGIAVPQPLPPPVARAGAGEGYEVALETDGIAPGQPSMLSFRVRRDASAVRVDRYLGARGHLVVLREGDLGYLHTHPEGDELDFETTFPSAGRYRAFLQFVHNGRLHTAAFTLAVRR
jgi:hypothetical protein